ncbi:DALR domain-containing protein, partial [uncultured Dubosiella sp.]
VNEESTTDATLDSGLWQPFIDALNDDLNTPNAITAVLECVKKINQTQRQKPLDCAALAAQTATLEKMMDVLGICLEFVHMTAEDKAVYRAWKEAVQEKNYEQADLYRAQLLEKGIL